MLSADADIRPEDYGSTAEFFAAIQDERSPASNPVRRIEDQDVDGVVTRSSITADRSRRHQRRAPHPQLPRIQPMARRLLRVRTRTGCRRRGAPRRTSSTSRSQSSRPRSRWGIRTVQHPAVPGTGSYAEGDWDRLFAFAPQSGVPIGMHIIGLRNVERRYDHSGIYLTQNMIVRGCSWPRRSASSSTAGCSSATRLAHRLGRGRDRLDPVGPRPDGPQLAPSPPLDAQRAHRGAELYFHRQVLATFTKDFVGLRELDSIGADNVMWSNDFPHAESNWPNSRKLADDGSPTSTTA